MLGIDASRTSYGQGQGQGQRQGIDSDIQASNQNETNGANWVTNLFQPSNNPSIVIGLDQNDSSKDRKSDISSSTAFTPSNMFTKPFTGGMQNASLAGDMINNKDSMFNQLMPSLVTGAAVYVCAYVMNMPKQDATIAGDTVGAAVIPSEYVSNMITKDNILLQSFVLATAGTIATMVLGSPMENSLMFGAVGGVAFAADKYIMSRAFM